MCTHMLRASPCFFSLCAPPYVHPMKAAICGLALAAISMLSASEGCPKQPVIGCASERSSVVALTPSAESVSEMFLTIGSYCSVIGP